MFRHFYSRANIRFVFGGVICALMSLIAFSFLVWTAPLVFGSQPQQYAEYPTHQEISQDLARLDKRVTVVESYEAEMRKEEVRRRLTVAEQHIISTSRDIRILSTMGWLLITGVFLPYLRDAWTYYSRAGRRKRKRVASINTAADAAEDAEAVIEKDRKDSQDKQVSISKGAGK